jgi:hypothetical protein
MITAICYNALFYRNVYGLLNFESRVTEYSKALAGNPSIEQSVTIPVKRDVSFKKWYNENIILLIDRLTKVSPWRYTRNKMIALIVLLLQRLGLLAVVKSLVKCNRLV